MITITINMSRTSTGVCVIESTMTEDSEGTPTHPFGKRLVNNSWKSEDPHTERECVGNLSSIVMGLFEVSGSKPLGLGDLKQQVDMAICISKPPETGDFVWTTQDFEIRRRKVQSA